MSLFKLSLFTYHCKCLNPTFIFVFLKKRSDESFEVKLTMPQMLAIELNLYCTLFFNIDDDKTVQMS